MKTQTLDNNSQASDPGGIRLSHDKMRQFHPELYQPQGLLRRLFNRLTEDQRYWRIRNEEHLLHGDSRAAVVVSIQPILLVAAYTDELDCVAMLRFPEALVDQYRLTPGKRLLTVNTYARGETPEADLENGPASYLSYSNFRPYIPDFLSDDFERIEKRKAQIAEPEWIRTRLLAQAYLAKHGQCARDGLPMRSFQPAPVKA